MNEINNKYYEYLSQTFILIYVRAACSLKFAEAGTFRESIQHAPMYHISM